MNITSDIKDIGFLLADVSRLMRRDFDRRVRGLSMTQVQWRAIAHLIREEGINQSALADRLDVAPITLGRLIDRLETAGWVRREPDPADRRACRLYLTPKAEPILDEMRAHARDFLEDAMSGVPSATQRQLVTALERIKQNLITTAADASSSSTEGAKEDVR
ncbi:MAG: MarR family transcriptional regulator [Gammaproteobacteria bacterium]